MSEPSVEIDRRCDLTAGPRKGTYNLFLASPAMVGDVRAAGIRIRPTSAAKSCGARHYLIADSQLGLLIERFGAEVTWYGQPIAP